MSEKSLSLSDVEGGIGNGQQNTFSIRIFTSSEKLSKKFNLPAEQVLDAYTDAIMILLEHIQNKRFRGESKSSTYLYQILFNKCRDLLKKSSTKKIEFSDFINTVEPSSQTFMKEFIEKEDVKNLHKYLDQIGQPCKNILLDWGYWGYKMEEIAGRNGFENGDQVKKRKYKCLQKLRKLVGYN